MGVNEALWQSFIFLQSILLCLFKSCTGDSRGERLLGVYESCRAYTALPAGIVSTARDETWAQKGGMTDMSPVEIRSWCEMIGSHDRKMGMGCGIGPCPTL